MLLSILTSAGVSVLLTAALIWLSKAWLSERLKGAIQHEYAEKLETFKAQLKAQSDVAVEQLKASNAQALALHTTASGTFSSIHAIGQERRLRAIEAMWGAIIDIRNEIPPGLIVADAFPEENYQELFFETPQLQQFINAVNASALAETKLARTSHEVDRWRPFLGEYLFSLYEAYRTLVIRVYVITALGIATKKVEPWYRDDVNRRLVTRLLTVDELKEFDESPTKFAFIRSAIEKKIVAKAARIVSGEASAAHMFDQGVQILDAVHQVNAALNKQGITAV
ncbi:MAG: hypothetical protein HY657_16930 [Acidobacteria bacterium]|nr:hypothetical protein [Acidobacteriota bacterium]